MTNFVLRPYQQEAVDRVWALEESGERRGLLQLVTGGGKTIIAAKLFQDAMQYGRRLVFCVPRISLVDQTVDKFMKFGLNDIGVIQADHPLTDYSKSIQVTSIQTLIRRKRIIEDNVLDPDFVIIDEAHIQFKGINRWLESEYMKDKFVIGLSATPWSRGLGFAYKNLIKTQSLENMIKDGYLSKYRVLAPTKPDLEGIKTVAGDYHEGQLADRMSNATIVADIVTTWLERAEGRPTIAFCVDTKHARYVQEQFLKSGISCDYVDAFTPLDERQRIEKRFHSGETKIVSSVGVLTTGIDWDVRCIIYARPTKSEMLFIQCVGRGLRTAEGKENCLILDHSGTFLKLGFPEDIDYQHDDLDFTKPGQKQKQKPVAEDRLPRECPACGFLKANRSLKCDECGHIEVVSPSKRNVNVIEAELAEIARTGKPPTFNKAEKASWPKEKKREWYLQLRHYQLAHGYKDGWCAHAYKELFLEWPPYNWRNLTPIQPSPDVLNYIRYKNIRRAYSASKRLMGK